MKNNCSHPCYFISIDVTKTRDQIKYKTKSKVKIFFEKVIKVNKVYYLYDEMAIIGGIGGFINLIRLIRGLTKQFIQKVATFTEKFFLPMIPN